MVSAFEFWSIQLHSTYSCQQGSYEVEDWSLSYHPNQAGPKGYQVGGRVMEGLRKFPSLFCLLLPGSCSLGEDLCMASQPEEQGFSGPCGKPSRGGRGLGGWWANPAKPSTEPRLLFASGRMFTLEEQREIQVRSGHSGTGASSGLLLSTPHTLLVFRSISNAHLWEVLPDSLTQLTAPFSRFPQPSVASSIVSSFHVIFVLILVFNFLFGNQF